MNQIFSCEKTPEIGQRLGIPFVRTLQEKITVKMIESSFEIEQSSTGLLAISGVVWDAGLLLVDYLSAHPAKCAGKAVLDLGCGTGICGVAALKLGANSVLFSDAVLLDCLEENIGGSIPQECIEFDWKNVTVPEKISGMYFDFILCSDVLYEKSIHDDLLRIILSLKFSELVISYKLRNQEAEQIFFEKLEKCFNLTMIDTSEIPNRNLSKAELSGLYLISVTHR